MTSPAHLICNCIWCISRLTKREIEVLSHLANGLSNEAIGQKLFIMPKTVEQHINRIFNKLGVPTASTRHARVEATLIYLLAYGQLADTGWRRALMCELRPRLISIILMGMPPEALRKNGRPSNRWQHNRITQEEKWRAYEHVQAAVLKSGYDVSGGAPLFALAKVQIDAYYWAKPIDYDGMACGAGAWLDAFTEYGVIPDDSPKYIKDYGITYYHATSKDDARVVLTVTEVEGIDKGGQYLVGGR